MKRTLRVSIAAIVVALSLSSPLFAQSQDYVLTANSWGAAQAAAVAEAGGTLIFSHDGAGVAVARSSAPDFLARVRASNAIQDAELDRVVQWQQPSAVQTVTADFTNPPNNERFFNTVQWAPQAIDAPAAWAMGCTGQGVRVAIIDGGIQDTHQDLAANFDVAHSISFVPLRPFNNDVGTTFWHGTHVAGIVAAVDNANGYGVIGIAPKATLIGVKVLHGGSGSFGAVLQGILYAATPIAQGGGGADIINMSLGAVFAKSDEGAGRLVGILNQVVNYADRLGVLVVSAAGNSALDLDHSGNLISVPAQSGAGIAVSATGPEGFALGATNFDRVASYTNFGTSAINVAAPGGDFTLPGSALCTRPLTGGGSITAPCWAYDLVLSDNVGGFAFAAGTSMASPAAAAVAALIKGHHPGISLGALKTALQNSAIDAGKNGADPFYGKGWVNALRACQY